MATADNFADLIEEGVRPFVVALRAAGLNTLSSCHHLGYIQASSSDPTRERMVIWNVMSEMGVEKWEANLFVNHSGFDSWEIKSDKFAAAGLGR